MFLRVFGSFVSLAIGGWMYYLGIVLTQMAYKVLKTSTWKPEIDFCRLVIGAVICICVGTVFAAMAGIISVRDR